MRKFESGERYMTTTGACIMVTDVTRGKRRTDCTVHDRGKTIRVQIAVLNAGDRTHKSEAVSFVGADGGFYTALAKSIVSGGEE